MIYEIESVYHKIPYKYDRSGKGIVQRYLNSCFQDKSQQLGIYFIVSQYASVGVYLNGRAIYSSSPSC